MQDWCTLCMAEHRLKQRAAQAKAEGRTLHRGPTQMRRWLTLAQESVARRGMAAEANGEPEETVEHFKQLSARLGWAIVQHCEQTTEGESSCRHSC